MLGASEDDCPLVCSVRVQRLGSFLGGWLKNGWRLRRGSHSRPILEMKTTTPATRMRKRISMGPFKLKIQILLLRIEGVEDTERFTSDGTNGTKIPMNSAYLDSNANLVALAGMDRAPILSLQRYYLMLDESGNFPISSAYHGANNGQMACGFGCKIRSTNVASVEAWAILKGLEWAWNKGVRKLVVRSDSKKIVEWIMGTNTSKGPLRNTMNKEQNKLADIMAKDSLGLNSTWIEWEEPPPNIKDVLIIDCRDPLQGADFLVFFSYMGLANGKTAAQVKEDVNRDFVFSLYLSWKED
nr:factor of DNA methylation 4-like [Ipomoea batatas]